MRVNGPVPPPEGLAPGSSLERGRRFAAVPAPGRRVGSRTDERPPRRRVPGRARGLQALPDRRRGRRHDAARQAPLEARSRCDRRARGTAARTEPRSSRRRTARRRQPRWPPRSSSRGHRLAWNRSGREPRLRGRLDPPRRSATPTWACSRSTKARCPRSFAAIRPRAVLLGNLFRDQLDRYGELEHIAERWRTRDGRPAPGDRARRQR